MRSAGSEKEPSCVIDIGLMPIWTLTRSRSSATRRAMSGCHSRLARLITGRVDL